MSGSLTKLKIRAYEDPDFATEWSDNANPLTVMINPASYSQRLAVDYTEDDAAGATGQARAFNKECGVRLDLELVLDGTGTVPFAQQQTVAQQIIALRRLGLAINPGTHRPNYVKLSWGTLLFKGQLQSLDVTYSLFNPDGSPLRAKVKASFLGFQDPLEAAKGQNRSSPDLTHRVTVRAGDTLPLLCKRIYGDSGYYVQVAAANGLSGFRSLPLGSVLNFPPLRGARS
ncbi:MAG TPA: hypothetical protein VIA98_04850 [Allosphingosinicella sp.]|jgi:nucleoid-associated protein YgaU